jgi:AmmeMemoRadiSam system protein A
MSRLSSEDRRALLDLARRAISSAIMEKRVLDFSAHSDSLRVPAGAFVTLHRSGRLRGCVGQVESSDPLAETIAHAAINAALYDFRFAPVTAEEVACLEIEISVLSPLDLIAPEAIIVGRHGLMIVKEKNRGVLLPQVAQERKWSGQRFLEETCAKAGLPLNAWEEPSTQVFAFTAEVFSETSMQASSNF